MKKLFILVIVIIFSCVSAENIYAQWTVLNGPTAGSISSLAIDRTSSNAGSNGKLYVGTNQAGIFLSQDGSSSFTNITNNLPSTTVTAVDVQSINVYAGTGGSGVWESSNSGTGWVEKNNGLTNQNVNSLKATGNYLFAATSSGVFRIGYGETSWTTINNGLTATNVTAIDYIDGKLYAGTTNGAFVSSDNGTTWTSIGGTLPNKEVKSFAAIGSRLIVGTKIGPYFSDNGGTSWTTPTTGTGGFPLVSLEVDGTDVWGATNGGGLYKSANNGANWSSANPSGAGICLWGTVVYKDVIKLIYGTNGLGLWSTSNSGTTWDWNNTGLKAGTVNGILSANNTIFTGVYGGGIQKSVSGGLWQLINNGVTSNAIKTFATDGTKLYAGGSYNGGMFESSDWGGLWAVSQLNKSIFAIYAASFSGTTRMFACEGDGLYTLNGSTWGKVTNSPSGVCQSIDFDGQLGVAGFYNTRPLLTTDGGINWQQVTGTPVSNNITAVEIMGSNIMIGTQNQKVQVSNDNGATWTAKNNGLPDYPVINSIARINSLWLMGTQFDGIWASNNAGDSWKQIIDGLMYHTVYSITTDGNNFYAGTFGGAFIRSYDDIINDHFPTQYSVTISSDPTNGGTTEGDGVYNAGTDVTITAFPGIGYEFVEWRENGNALASNNPYLLHVTSNRVITAFFRRADYTVTLSCDPTDKGRVTGADTYPANTEVTISATPEPGYKFVRWTENGNVASLNSIFHFVIRSNRTLTAVFELDKPLQIFTVTPQNQATGIPLNSSLSWENRQGSIFTTTKVFIVESPGTLNYLGTPAFMSTDPVSNYTPSTSWKPNTTYIWGLTQINGSGETNSGAFYFTTTSASAVEDKIIPTSYRLYQNYPNPFNPSTTIKFQLPKAGKVKLNLYNTLGLKVLNLTDNIYSAGTHSINLNLSNLVSGIYFYMIECDSFRETKKLILLK